MASKAHQPQILQIDPPHELFFKGPFTDVISNQLKLTNPSDKQVCFKVKTTAPKQYCVRPNSGVIPPKGSVNVAIMLQPFDFSVEDKERSKHKFMVQTAFVADGETNLDNIWKNIPQDELMDSKLRVHLELPDANNLDKGVVKQLPLKAMGGNDQEAELRRQIDDNKRLNSKLQHLQSENEQLRARLTRLESTPPQQRGTSSKSAVAQQLGEFKIVHIVMAVLVALLLGLIFGKMF